MKDIIKGEKLIIKYSDVIHIRYEPNNIFNGDKFNCKTNMIPDLIDKQIKTMITQLANNGKLSGILKLKGGMAADGKDNAKHSKLKAFASAFINENKTGLAVLDSNEEFQQLSRDFYSSNIEDIDKLKNYIYSQYGVNEKIINGTYNNEEYEAFYNNTLEPIVTKIKQEFNRKLFTRDQYKSGEEILINKKLIIGGNLKDKAQFLREMVQLDVLELNEARVLNGVAPKQGRDIFYSEIEKMGMVPANGKENAGGENE
jgi:HK97 family phage portal protein